MLLPHIQTRVSAAAWAITPLLHRPSAFRWGAPLALLGPYCILLCFHHFQAISSGMNLDGPGELSTPLVGMQNGRGTHRHALRIALRTAPTLFKGEPVIGEYHVTVFFAFGDVIVASRAEDVIERLVEDTGRPRRQSFHPIIIFGVTIITIARISLPEL